MEATSIAFPGFTNLSATIGSRLLKRSLSSSVAVGGKQQPLSRLLKPTIHVCRNLGRGLNVRSASISRDAPVTTSSGLPLKEVPGSYGLPFFGAFFDKMAFYWTEGTPHYYENRMAQHKSTVYRMNTVPGPPFFPDPRVIVLLDQKSYRTLFDVDKVDKKDAFVGTFVPDVAFTGGYRVLAYLDPLEEKHTILKSFCFEILKSSGRRVFPEFHKALSEVFVQWETGLEKNGKVKFNEALSVGTVSFNFRALLNADPTDPDTKATLGKDAASIIKSWIIPQIIPLSVIRLPIFLKLALAPFIELLFHTFPMPYSLVKTKHQKIVAFFRENAKETLDMAEKQFGLDREEALHNLLFYTCFNAWGGINFLFPAIVSRLGSTSEEFQRELSAEVRKAIEDNGGLNPAALNSMPLVQSAVYEVFRTDPPVAYQYGRAKKDLIIESHDAAFQVKKGEMLAGYMPLAHRDPKVFADPEVFNPKRFLGEKGQKLVQYVIWSNGPQTETPSAHNKQCPGKDFITTIANLLVAEIYSTYEMLKADGDTLVSVKQVSVCRVILGHALERQFFSLKSCVGTCSSERNASGSWLSSG
ncbi:hypothetical protein R1sor_008262 [Riccia sorocarpa]|uniref:Allene oxide synthase n=1 Tax=Riccia sorocarpa TaxID=122646 RepID=A0ABD3HV15_9MARC